MSNQLGFPPGEAAVITRQDKPLGQLYREMARLIGPPPTDQGEYFTRELTCHFGNLGAYVLAEERSERGRIVLSLAHYALLTQVEEDPGAVPSDCSTYLSGKVVIYSVARQVRKRSSQNGRRRYIYQGSCERTIYTVTLGDAKSYPRTFWDVDQDDHVASVAERALQAMTPNYITDARVHVGLIEQYRHLR